MTQLLIATSSLTIPIATLLLIWRGVIWADRRRVKDLARRKAKVLDYKLRVIGGVRSGKTAKVKEWLKENPESVVIGKDQMN